MVASDTSVRLIVKEFLEVACIVVQEISVIEPLPVVPPIDHEMLVTRT